MTALLESITSDKRVPSHRVRVAGTKLSPQLLNDPQVTDLTRTYTLWAPYPRRRGVEEGVWRVREFLGRVPRLAESAPQPSDAGSNAPDCLVLDDANLGFRGTPSAWPACLRAGATGARHIILKVANPIGAGPLWEHLTAHHARVLTVYVSVSDLRKDDSRIGEALSWEQISTDIVHAVAEHRELSRAARVVISLGAAGAVVVEPRRRSFLVYDASGQEGDWESVRPGFTIGLGTCIVAALAWQVPLAPEKPVWLEGVRRGLLAARRLHEHGYELMQPPEPPSLRFPLRAISSVIGADAPVSSFHCIDIPQSPGRWTVLEQCIPDGHFSVAERVVERGPDHVLRSVGVPVEMMGAWSSVDRTEIESMRSVRNIVREYLAQPRRSRPLSIAVFGPPGSGKSFAIKQMAQEWSRGATPMRVLEFNLSQLTAAAELNVALQRVRDSVVGGALPLVFWDEFDSTLAGQELGWLRYFLAPMQDGGFLEDGGFRPIGAAIFVFAGGTHRTMAAFKITAGRAPETKATDFISRLRGYVDILGVNPSDAGDTAAYLRRAFLLRTLLQQRGPQMLANGRLAIDPGLLRAFLAVSQYLHGARSMEAIVDMSALTGRLKYERSSLPASHQLALHTDADEFLRHLRGEQATTATAALPVVAP